MPSCRHGPVGRRRGRGRHALGRRPAAVDVMRGRCGMKLSSNPLRPVRFAALPRRDRKGGVPFADRGRRPPIDPEHVTIGTNLRMRGSDVVILRIEVRLRSARAQGAVGWHACQRRARGRRRRRCARADGREDSRPCIEQPCLDAVDDQRWNCTLRHRLVRPARRPARADQAGSRLSAARERDPQADACARQLAGPDPQAVGGRADAPVERGAPVRQGRHTVPGAVAMLARRNARPAAVDLGAVVLHSDAERRCG